MKVLLSPDRKTAIKALPKGLQKEVNVTLEGLSLEEQVSLLAGADFWRTVEIQGRVAGIKTTDGPSGARGQFFSNGTKAAFFPSGVSLAATWDTSLIRQVGEALGEEAQSKQANVLLAPTACNHRSPLGGRNFESFSEDPYLSGKLAAAYVNGVQSKGVAVAMKHFVANEQETNRFTVNEIIDERTLREIYLKPFEIAMRDAGPWAIMCSYNAVNGQHADVNDFTMKQVLRKEWGYDGLVMSDWGGTHDPVDSIKAGLDLEMPGPAHRRGDNLLKAIEESNNDPELLVAVKTGARHVLELIARSGQWGRFGEEPEIANDKPEHRELIRKAGAEGIVLLKNENMALPIPKSVKKIAWIGPNANECIAGGGGSANLNPHYLTNPLDSIREAAKEHDIEVNYEIGCQTEKWVKTFPVTGGRVKTSPTGGEDGMILEFFQGRECQGEVAEARTAKTSTIFLMDGKPPCLADKDYSVRLTAYFTPEVSGEHILGLGAVGPTKVYVNDELFLDHTHWTEAGELFFTSGSEEITKRLTLRSGEWYKLVTESTTKSPDQEIPDMGNDNLDFASAVGIRLGVDLVRDAQEHISRAAALAGESDVAVVVVGMNNEWESEGYDRHAMHLPGKQDELISAVAKANPRTIVVNQSGCAVSMPWLDEVQGLLQVWYQGQEAGSALADVLLGKRAPGGRLPISFPKRVEDNPSWGNFGDCGAKSEVQYSEGVFVGYRHYVSHEVPVLFPFGFGLSYTTFSHSSLRFTGCKNTLAPGVTTTVEMAIKNTGRVTSNETVQVYISPRAGAPVGSPTKELKGFAKVELSPGEEKVAKVVLDEFAVGHFEPSVGKWRAERGAYEVSVGRSVEDVVGKLEVIVEETYEWIF
ncbi:glycosyl hydrolase family 3 protein [Tuber brumale]|nr:glycosyl hydrolase family 3 protein [Tuber brumale]